MNSQVESIVRKDRCANPFNLEGHKGKALRKISESLLTKFPTIPDSAKICYKCRRLALSNCDVNSDSSSINDSLNSSLISNPSKDCDISTESVVTDSANTSPETDLAEILNGLKEKFALLPSNDPDKIAILTILPADWTIKRIASEFNTSSKSVRKAKELKKLHGSLSRPPPKVGNAMPKNVVDKIVEFYEDDDNSRLLPGMKNKKTVKIDGKKVLKQKRLILFNLKVLHIKFRKENPDVDAGLSKFCEVRPENCVLAGEGGTHVVCVCVLHQNFTLMLNAINLPALTKNAEFPLENLDDVLNFILCSEPKDECHFDICKSCGGTDKFRNYLLKLLQNCDETEIKYSLWCTTDRANMETKTSSIEDFLTVICSILGKLKSHNFINEQQKAYFKQMKSTLNDGEFLVLCDFSENYAFVVQDAAQAFHYNNNQTTVYTVIYYYRKDGKLCHESIIILSDCLSHDSVAVYICNSIVTEHIKKHHAVKKNYICL